MNELENIENYTKWNSEKDIEKYENKRHDSPIYVLIPREERIGQEQYLKK